MTYIAVILASALVLGLLFLYFMYVTAPKQSGQKGTERVNLSVIPGRWAEVQEMMRAGGPANYKQSIMQADKLVETVLGTKVPGDTMGERLKNSGKLFSPNTYDGLWTAHKIRNRVAHDPEFEGLSSDAQLAVRNFEKALRELRAL